MEIQTINDFVMMEGGNPVTDSRKVARHFGKPHKTVLRAFDRMDCSPEFNRHNFVPVAYVDAKGEMRRAVQMTKDGFMFLVMGFTGAKAAVMKEAFIEAFNRMAEFIQTQALGQWERWNAAWR
ncbi:MAG: Rha family transcriptional regulator [Pseudomonadota bacterium]|nr:Rha family transcriptional regulator [Pseudomonadota bacterium]